MFKIRRHWFVARPDGRLSCVLGWREYQLYGNGEKLGRMMFSRSAIQWKTRLCRSGRKRLFSSSGEIRSAFLKYFEDADHTVLPSSLLVPENDGTLLFTNAGMVQFKERFLGQGGKFNEVSRACTAQRCLRAGGKHNDLSNVGFTPRHHTFFEMLGNFSFGNYFKEEAIVYAWNFVTKELCLPASKLRITVHKADHESARIWKQVAPQLSPVLLGDEDNFWSMGEGERIPCGPCTEIFYDLGEDIQVADERWLEIWNLVFMEYQTDGNGHLNKLPNPCVDTGMGLERISSVLQGVKSNYETDLFLPLLEAIQESPSRPLTSPSHHQHFARNVIADHIRAISFLIADGVVPSNVRRGHVLRRLMRRALVYGRKLGINDHFMTTLLPALESTLGSQYPQLLERRQTISSIIQHEEQLFYRTLDNGMLVLEKHLKDKSLDAEVVFKLNDTYGFPLDLTAGIAAEQGISLDFEEVDRLIQSHRTKSGSGVAWKQACELPFLDSDGPCTFVGYETLESNECEIKSVTQAGDGRVWLVLEPCPFYGEAGGQVGDRGTLHIRRPNPVSLRVLNSIKTKSGNITLLVDAPLNSTEHQLAAGDLVDANVDRTFREKCSVHHSATHLLHASLQKRLGTGIMQAGSLVDDRRLRFDFTCSRPLSLEEVRAIEEDVNSFAQEACDLSFLDMSLDEAKKEGACMLFSESYGDRVRAVSIGSGSSVISLELCGGTHVPNTRFVYPFKIISESSAAAGTRRIQAVAGEAALEWLNAQKDILDTACMELKVSAADLLSQINKLKEKNKMLAQEVDRLEKSKADNKPTKVWGDNYCIHMVPASNSADKKKVAKQLQEIANSARSEDPDMLHFVISGRRILCTVGDKSTCSYADHAGECLKRVLAVLGGKGGGNSKLAHGELQSQAKSIKSLSEQFASVFR